MLAFIIAPFFIALEIFVFIRSINHIKTYKIKGLKLIECIFALVLFGGLCFVIAGFILPTSIPLKRVFTKIGFYWLGIILYLFVGLLIALLCRIIIWLFARNKSYNIKKARDFTVIFVICFTVLMNIYGVYNAHDLRITNYEVVSSKQSNIDELNVVLISDLHLGYNVGIKEIKDMVNKINELNPDVVIVAGDIFDNEFDAVENPQQMAEILSKIRTKYGKYATYGNHDIEEKILVGFTFSNSKNESDVQADERMNEFIENAGFTFLYDSYELIEDSVYIYGRPDGIKYNFGNATRKTPEQIVKDLDLNKTIICVDHEPGQLDELASVGIDLDLSGHTHNGQIWPGTISIDLFWDNSYGMKLFDNMTSIVTSGVGLFGVNMRTGCFPEIVDIKIKFN